MAHSQGNRRPVSADMPRPFGRRIGKDILRALACRSFPQAALLAAVLALPPAAAAAPAPPVKKPKAHAAAAPRTQTKAKAKTARPVPAQAPTLRPAAGAEARLIETYRLFGRGQSREALAMAQKLVADHPNFQLAQLVLGDLLAARVPPGHGLPDGLRQGAGPAMAELAEESRRRLRALRERPPPGAVPSPFLVLSPSIRYALAVDTSRSRLYLLENSPGGLQLAADYYISVGKSGIGKKAEGDARTPLGVYHVTSNLDPKSLRDFYGAGALPINYPNPYDLRRGRTGGGIWLHGTPKEQFARAPLSTDGCIVMANDDLRQLLRRVQIGATPVVIAQNLKWVAPRQTQGDVRMFDQVLAGWRDARARGDAERLQEFYSPDSQQISNRKFQDISLALPQEIRSARGRHIELKDISYLRWTEEGDALVATFGEVAHGARTGRQRRQYWWRQDGKWKIFLEEISGA
jgi:murein L,D-transpeptidase YafK